MSEIKENKKLFFLVSRSNGLNSPMTEGLKTKQTVRLPNMGVSEALKSRTLPLKK